MKKSTWSILCMPLFVMAFLLSVAKANAAPPDREYYEIRVYSLKNPEQEKRMDSYLRDALLPGLHRAGIKQVGVFKGRGNDTAASPKIYLLIPYKSLNDISATGKKLDKDKAYLAAGADYIDAAYDNPTYTRFEKIILQAFNNMPVLQAPAITTPRNERVYELRSYESATEKQYVNKVKMFNDGDEIGLFKKLGFNAVFYGEVIAGSTMPNLMYMTSFDNMSSREEHWKSFMTAPEWKTVSAMPIYSHNTSKSVITFLFPAEYSDL